MPLLFLACILITSVVGLMIFTHPFGAIIIECAVSMKLHGTHEGLWILAMLLTWTLASFPYGLFATYAPALRRVSHPNPSYRMLYSTEQGLKSSSPLRNKHVTRRNLRTLQIYHLGDGIISLTAPFAGTTILMKLR
jgi:hypothetical protein